MMCEIRESESLTRRLESLAAENDVLRVEVAQLDMVWRDVNKERCSLRAEVVRLKAELRERAERAERERDAILKWARRYCPECEGDGLRIAGTFVSDEGVCEGHEERCDCDATILKAAGLDAAPAGDSGG